VKSTKATKKFGKDRIGSRNSETHKKNYQQKIKLATITTKNLKKLKEKDTIGSGSTLI